MPFVQGRKLTQEQYAELYNTYLHARTIHEAETPNFDVWLDEYEGIEAALDYVMRRSPAPSDTADAFAYALRAFYATKEK